MQLWNECLLQIILIVTNIIQIVAGFGGSIIAIPLLNRDQFLKIIYGLIIIAGITLFA